MRILIIEDEKLLAETLADIITQNKDIADICYDGRSGLDHALSGIYDAVLLDVMLPEGMVLKLYIKCEKVGTQHRYSC